MRNISIISGQFSDIPFEDLCKKLSEIGYDGIELACLGDHFDVKEASENIEYCKAKKEILRKYNLECRVISGHLIGQCVSDIYDERLDNFAPLHLAGKPEEIKKWAISEMKLLAKAAHNMNVDVVSFFTGSPIWRYIYSFPQVTKEMIDKGYDLVLEEWSPIMDEYDKWNVKLALEIHPTEIAFDYYSTIKLLEKFSFRETLGITFDPSHLLWQGINPTVFLKDFEKHIYNVHFKDVKINKDGRAGLLGSYLEFGDNRRGWNFVSLGHGDVDFEEIARQLNQMKYMGNISIEWEDSGMDRIYGATEALKNIHKFIFPVSDFAFDRSLSSKSK